MASLGHTGKRRVVLGHTLNTLQDVITKKSHDVLSKFTILCWAEFTAIRACVRPAGRGLDTPASLCASHLRAAGLTGMVLRLSPCVATSLTLCRTSAVVAKACLAAVTSQGPMATLRGSSPTNRQEMPDPKDIELFLTTEIGRHQTSSG